MERPKPEKIVIEYSDGSKKESPFELLPATLRFEILRQPFASDSSPEPEKEKFLLLEWDDGWKEVMEVDVTCSEINRYYVISRPEDVGRLSLNKRNGYPELVEIVRKPLGLKRVTFMDTFQLDLEKSTREGKKTDHFFGLSKEGDAFYEEMEAFKRALAEEEIDPLDIGTGDLDKVKGQWEKIRRNMGLKAAQRQQDVYDFIAYLAKKGTKSR